MTPPDRRPYGAAMPEPRDAASVKRRLELTDNFDAFLDELSAMEPEPGAARLPDPAGAAALLSRLRVSDADIAEAVPALPAPETQAELWWLLERCRHRLVSDLGGGADLRIPWPDLPTKLGPAGRYFYLAVLLACLPDVRRFHADHGVPDEVAWATLGDVGEKVGLHRRFHGVGGLDRQNWLTLHFRGVLYALGRLQFNLTEIPAGTRGLTAGAPALGVHIPETGPMSPEACDESFRRAPGFFARHLGVECRFAICGSWLLDDQLAEYLPATSNIIRFQRRFRLIPDTSDGDADIIGFVFRRTDPDLDDLPQLTSLQRAVVTHLRSGRHWRLRFGWLRL